ncbi:MAG: pyruvate dehydrogenase complex dihydrolipoamide acetyltransferase [Algoriphagus sp.]|uniref:pyruvate dehydrogenase complex dihydrolipoamide acetyltransferase n=1 Tax=Algoriphagus sp. TaxID=1872435 RepID=UPI002726D918|nr:pyruvate dehydrogenase complex dihydrolipoamide acetyltransferase [Algoriphagus sp.]MDO8967163.1 pyruvate dehydrogenase complex dihydrolipoamide acetyltransferase [Algoriphagus sp.]MDP2042207.1 pyruvate dehydrogenase complex dihydrolipoamide acetyltransferase [Algoriphagus sp.]MDP3198307.1 pyruvate dehydrogenase complex dihydrolipoamide acetyltransferase [Algoriphagus sp.]MDP3470370.1 pyruvate dehydrogenase complex dihydrolipoamide acetyltransferase [Algoriphagus sp.]
MAEIIRMPKMSDTMEEGVIASWLKKVGDTVKPGDILAEVETDKATMELESYDEGVLLYIGVQEKDSVPVNGVIAIIGEKGEAFEHLLTGATPPAESKTEESKEKEAKPEAKVEEPAKAEAATEKIDTSAINATVITMPKMSDTMAEGTIATWLKKVGDTVKSGEIIAEVETDKATMELESYEDGVLLYIGVEAGNSVAVDGVIAVIGEKGADYQTLLKAQQGTNMDSAPAEAKSEAPAETKSEKPAPTSAPATTAAPTSDAGTANGERVKASPLAKKIAEEKGVDIRAVSGSGEGGRVVKRDVENFVPAVAPSAAVASAVGATTSSLGQESFREEKVSQMRKVIAKRLAESKFGAPHFYLTMEINMDKAMDARKSMNEVSPVKISFNDMVIKASASALRQHPKVNSSWLGDKIRYNDHIHIGMAVAVEEGLLVPVIRFADQLSLSQISNQAKTLGGKAKTKELQPKDWEGNTFTISNLGMFGIDEFTAIINPPDACILAVGGIKETVIVKDGQMKIGNVMKVTLSCDHRVVDGAVGSAFLLTLKSLLEDPVRILI